ncbi:concanavalin A-like lectin/glucanase superfamily protein [Flavobacterium sp. 90]|uniref:LamG domain-containing protein n=1 Tax=unclassified Flavobacterium TaxID=196869 RepID=UPI000EB53D14|nr:MULTISPECIES: LamG domain-containing protein [unclassified Flavobacterium]RKR08317.1 concanavalin A-like lectin/glucanase superfamily protein [Flavobacterium sp. 81]TCK57504.1 concanavalin A-like lectin/glucanase superfamily protein [Flavobacterium sp. 90]
MNKLLLTLMFVSFFNVNAQNPVQQFNFDGNTSNSDKTISFLGSSTFANDRNGVANGAIRLTNKFLQTVVGDLPQDNKPRTISVWVKFNAITSVNYIFGYGSPINTQYFGLVQQAATGSTSDLSLAGWGTTNNVIVATPLAKGVWYQYSVTYDGTTSKIYRNGELLKSSDAIVRATKGYILKLGQMNTALGINADVDDLKIYNVAMTDEQVMESYNSSKPATTEGENSLTVKKGTANVKTDGKNASEGNVIAKKVEVFSQGKKIIRNNTTNISDLPEGTYLLKITNGQN